MLLFFGVVIIYKIVLLFLFMKHQKRLSQKIADYEFYPEVYLYPTPRTYTLLNDFSLYQADFSKEINVYFHIPFCKQICTFCGYLKMIDSNGDLQEKYVSALLSEIELYHTVLEDKIVKTLHFGGGTPSLLFSSQLERIITALIKINPKLLETAEEVSIEATPESVEKNKFVEYKNLGINRVSIGIESLQNSEIVLAGRHNLAAASLQAITLLKEIGIANVVADLMIGIEGQTVLSFEKSVITLLEYSPDTVEFYALGLMPQTRLGKFIPQLISSREIYQCYTIGRDLFLNSGYVQDCHNRYVIPAKGSFLQEDYVWNGMSLVGFGAGVRSYAKNVHYRNAYSSIAAKKAIIEYINSMQEMKLNVQTGIFLNRDEKIRQYAIGNLECLSKKDFTFCFGEKFENYFSNIYDDLLGLGLATDDNEVITLTEKGLLFRDLICSEFFSDTVQKLEEAYRPKKI